MSNNSLIYQNNWNSLNLTENKYLLIICIFAIIFHIQIWLQMFIEKIKFDFSFIFPLCYMITDILLLLCYFIQYIIRIRSWIPLTIWFCYFEAYSMFYINLIELYCLTGLNICRYWLIIRNDNIYINHRRKLILSIICIPIFILSNFILENLFSWCIVMKIIGGNCTLKYTNIFVRIWNLIILLIIPSSIAFIMLIRALKYLQNFHAQQRILRRNYHRQLIIHSFSFYSIWISLWLPYIFIKFLDLDEINDTIQFIAQIANTLEILVDPFIACFLDKRFAQAWNKLYQWIKRYFRCCINRRVNPVFQIPIVR